MIRWDAVRAVNELPDYMKICFLALYNTVNEMAYEILKDNGQNVLVCLQKAVNTITINPYCTYTQFLFEFVCPIKD